MAMREMVVDQGWERWELCIRRDTGLVLLWRHGDWSKVDDIS